MSEAHFPTIGEVFVDRYRIEMIIGTGGFSQVYRARQTDLGRDVAIKVLKPVVDANKTEEEQLAKFEQVAKRFEREAKLISRLKDRNTVMMYDYGSTEDGLLYMVLEYVDGNTITELLVQDGALAPARVVKIVRESLQSLHEAHSMGVLHRDIKPSNIMVYDHVGRADLVKVLDFGIAKTVDSGTGDRDDSTSSSDVTADGVLVGTPRYMSPEQIRGKRLGSGSDIYSMGLVAYEMLMGTKAVEADSSLRIIARHLDTEPILVPLDASVPARLGQIVNKMLLKDPADRYDSCEEVLADLQTWDEQVAVPSPHEPPMTVDASDLSLEIAQARSDSTRWLVGGSVTLVLAIVAMLAMRGNPSDPQDDPAREPEQPVQVAAEIAEPDAVPPDEIDPPAASVATDAAASLLGRSIGLADDTATATAEYAAKRTSRSTKRPRRKKTKPTGSATVKKKKKKSTPFILDQ